MKSKKTINEDEINDISEHDIIDTSDMDVDMRKSFITSTLIGAILLGVNLWTIIRILAKGSGTTKMLIACIVAGLIIPIVFIPIFKLIEKKNDYTKLIPCIRILNRINWILMAAPVMLIIIDFVEFGFSVRFPRGLAFYIHLGILAACYLLFLCISNSSSKAYNKEEPLHAMISTSSNDNHIHGWGAFVGILGAAAMILITSEWFNS